MTRQNKNDDNPMPEPRTELDGADHEAAYWSLNRWLAENTGEPYEDPENQYDDTEDDEPLPDPEVSLEGGDWESAAATLDSNYPADID